MKQQEKSFKFITGLTLYPTRFRWNTLRVAEALEELFFISHTVQMKLREDAVYSEYYEELYIPHGSDETYISYERYRNYYIVLNPHGSDETGENIV